MDAHIFCHFRLFSIVLAAIPFTCMAEVAPGNPSIANAGDTNTTHAAEAKENPSSSTGAHGSESSNNGLTTNEPVYFIVGVEPHLNAKFQVSFAYRLLSESPAADNDGWRNFFIGYTQTAIWDLHALSKPFYDTSYRPSLYYSAHQPIAQEPFDLGYALGFEHESNGKAGVDSRSINIAFIRPDLDFLFGRDEHLELSAKTYYYIEKSENADIQRYRGYADVRLAYKRINGFEFSVTGRKGTYGGRGSILGELSYPMSGWPMDEIKHWHVPGYIYFQYFNGWGETILDYDRRSESQLRVGWLFYRF